ncbi:hypothetical protein VKT23_016824 [Stygiomarasmius scandens]|uniref:Uncharacterized protein n=1 Tax=Marasmiellus scandens TaxID=2682957 RepID=A0ABR1IU82_9AGAR
MMKSLVAVVAVFAATVSAESHTVTLNNKCGKGTPVFQVAGGQEFSGQGSHTVNGPIKGGLAWIKGAFGCGDANGLNCGDVEFTLINPGDDVGNTQNAVDYSLVKNSGNHVFKYRMDFQAHGCTLQPAHKPCTGGTQQQCPGAFTTPTDGTVFQCTGSDVGVSYP